MQREFTSKQVALLLLAIIAAYFLLTRNDDPPTAAPDIAIAPGEPFKLLDPAKEAAAIKALKAEPKIIDLVHEPNETVQWRIGVKSDQGKWFGYAEYICIKLEELGVREEDAVVRIIDYHRFMTNDGDSRDASLGGVSCKDGRRWDP